MYILITILGILVFTLIIQDSILISGTDRSIGDSGPITTAAGIIHIGVLIGTLGDRVTTGMTGDGIITMAHGVLLIRTTMDPVTTTLVSM